MAKYMKPKISVIAASASSFSMGACATTTQDIDLIESILGFEISEYNFFGSEEACATQVPIEGYCKFTSVENGSMKLFTS